MADALWASSVCFPADASSVSHRLPWVESIRSVNLGNQDHLIILGTVLFTVITLAIPVGVL